MRKKTAGIDVVVKCPDVLNVGIWRSFSLKGFKYKFKEGYDGIYLEVTYALTKIYDNEGKNSNIGVNYKYVLYRDDGLVDKCGFEYRLGLIKMQQTVKQTLRIYLDDVANGYKLVFMEC